MITSRNDFRLLCWSFRNRLPCVVLDGKHSLEIFILGPKIFVLNINELLDVIYNSTIYKVLSFYGNWMINHDCFPLPWPLPRWSYYHDIGSTGWLHGFLCLFNFSNQINSSMGLFKKYFFVHYLPQNLELFNSYRILFSTLYIPLVLESTWVNLHFLEDHW